MSARFEIIGTIKRMNVPESGKVSFLTVSVDKEKSDGSTTAVSLEMKYFGNAKNYCNIGDKLLFKGDIGVEPVKDGQNNVKIGGYDKWVPALIVESFSTLIDDKDDTPF